MNEAQPIALARQRPGVPRAPPRRPRPRARRAAPKRRVFSTFTNGVCARHHDRRGDAQAARMIGHALRMVAGRHRDHAAPRACSAGQLHQAVERAALLERGGVLQVLELQPKLGAGDVRQCPRRQARGDDDLAREPCRGGPRHRPTVTLTGTAAAGPSPSRSSRPEHQVHVLDGLAGGTLDQVVEHADQDCLAGIRLGCTPIRHRLVPRTCRVAGMVLNGSTCTNGSPA